MTDSLHARTPDDAPDDRAPEPGPYVPPAVLALGKINAVTAGPNEGGGNIDQLFGSTGGFNAVGDIS